MSSSRTASVSDTTVTPTRTTEAAFVHQHLNGTFWPYALNSDKEQHGITSSHLKKERRTLILHYIKTFTILTLLLWACLSIFWGSAYKLLYYFSDLTINVYDFDSAASANGESILGQAFVKFANEANALPMSTPHAGYKIVDVTSGNYPNGEQDAIKDVLQVDCWAAVIIHANATSSWTAAVESGTTYDPQGTMGIYYMGARYYQVLLLYVRPMLIQNVVTAITTASLTATSTILTSLSTTYTAPASAPAASFTVTASLANLEAVPVALGSPFGYYIYDLRPQTAWGAAAVFEAGDIYYLIFTFPLAMWHYMGRTSSKLSSRLTLKALYLERILVPLFFYLWMSLWYTCIIAAFKVPFDTVLGKAGFVVDWALNYCTLCALGFAFETMISVLTPKFLPLFLIVWIILNITSSFLPLALTGRFYNFFIIFPFYHHTLASKIIFFGTSPVSYLGVHFGALIATVAVNWTFLFPAIWLERWRDERAARKEQEKKKEEEGKRREKDGGEGGQ